MTLYFLSDKTKSKLEKFNNFSQHPNANVRCEHSSTVATMRLSSSHEHRWYLYLVSLAFPTNTKVLGYLCKKSYFLTLSCSATLLLLAHYSGLPGSVSYFSGAEHRKDRFNCQSRVIKHLTRLGPSNEEHWHATLITSGLTFVKRPQSETQTGGSGICYENAKLLHQQKAEADDFVFFWDGWQDEWHCHQETWAAYVNIS